ncbi:MAG: M55 family metallopeptidase [Candidatus Aminicenantes bacterium]|nr:M55 family metallopeptidase [Candidatus Aminicenantes bacterium]
MIKKTVVFGLALAFMFAMAAAGQTPAKGLKVFISVDMEGVCGVINWDETGQGGPDYGMFRTLMTQEVNAAIAGAVAAGATEILVRDAHDSARNILPELLDPRARLLREWTYGPLSMMEGIDKTYDAAIFIGYHARAGTPDAVLKHTMTTKLLDVIINGKKMPEAGINGLIAGHFGVPVVLVSGDQAIARQAKELFGDIETAVVKEAISTAAIMLHPSKARDLIRDKTTAALKRLKDFKSLKFNPPYALDVAFADEALAQKASWIPGAVRKDEHTVSFTTNDFMEMLKLFRLSKM